MAAESMGLIRNLCIQMSLNEPSFINLGWFDCVYADCLLYRFHRDRRFRFYTKITVTFPDSFSVHSLMTLLITMMAIIPISVVSYSCMTHHDFIRLAQPLSPCECIMNYASRRVSLLAC